MPALDEILTAYVILPSQFYDNRGCRIEEAPVMSISMHAILRDALECVAGRTGKKGFGARRARRTRLTGSRIPTTAIFIQLSLRLTPRRSGCRALRAAPGAPVGA